MDILLVTDTFLPQLGGVERHVSTLLNYLSSKNINTSILTSTIEKHELDSKYNIDRSLNLLEKKNALDWPYTFIKNSKLVKDTINAVGKDYDIVHYHGPHILYIKDVTKKIKIINTLHGIFPACISFWGVTDWCGEKPSAIKCARCTVNIRKAYLPLFLGMTAYSSYFYRNISKSIIRYDHLLAVSEYVKKVINNTYNLNNISTVYNFIDIEKDIKTNLNEKLNVFNEINFNDDIILLYSGRLDRQKGIHILIDSYKKLKSKYDNLELVLTGKGDLEGEVKKLEKTYDSVHYLGYLERSKQINLLNRSNIFISPSIYPDACPTTIIEAMALGKPVVSTTVGGIPELIINGITGSLVPPGDVSELVKGVSSIIEAGPGSFQKNCVNQAIKFDINRVGPKITQIYEEVVK